MARSLSLLLLLSLAAACAHGAGAIPAVPDAPPADPSAAPPADPLAAPPADPSAAPAVPAEAAPQLSVHGERARAVVIPRRAEARAPASGARAAPPEEPGQGTEDAVRGRLVRSARRYLGRRFAGDCSGFVLRVFADAHVALPPLRPESTLSEALYRALSPVSRPRPGDLAFFHGTRRPDRSRAARRRFTHVALVERVDGERVTLIHRGSRGVRRLTMNLDRPHDSRENGMVRRRRARDRPGTRYLAGELFAGYASALQDEAVASTELPRSLLE
jgi:cell wall-associated NlpC family hydrolase